MKNRERSILDEFLKDSENARTFRQEVLILRVTERLCQLMDEMQISRTELASRMNVSKAEITRLLSGERNMTLKTVSDLYGSLDRSFQPSDEPLQSSDGVNAPPVTVPLAADQKLSTGFYSEQYVFQERHRAKISRPIRTSGRHVRYR